MAFALAFNSLCFILVTELLANLLVSFFSIFLFGIYVVVAIVIVVAGYSPNNKG